MSFEPFTSIQDRAPRRFIDSLFILLLTIAGIAAMGYHPGLEDDGIYLSAVKFDLNPALYPRDADFFRLQTQATLFDGLIAGFVRVTHVPLPWAELLWQFLALYSILWSAHSIAQKMFPERGARWAGVALLGAMFTLPVAGTALTVADQHLHPRSLATALILMAIDRMLAKRIGQAALFLLIALLMHPIMAVLGVSFCFFLALALTDRMYARLTGPARARLASMPLGWMFEPGTRQWKRALDTRSYYFLYKWTWYEWLGAIGPLVLFWALWRWASRSDPLPSGSVDAAQNVGLRGEKKQPQILRRSPAARGFAQDDKQERSCEALLARFAFALLLYGVFQQVLAMILLAPSALVRITPLQPMRYLHLVYVFLVLMAGGLLGRYVLKEKIARWAFFLIATYGGMFVSQRMMFPASEHLELPGRAPRNSWLEAFAWIRENTPADAYFALDPSYLSARGEDYHSFRALAQRSQLADAIKDAAVVTQVPELAPRWTREVDAQAGWSGFQWADFQRLNHDFGVSWFLLPYPPPARLKCIWHNDRLSVCRIAGPTRVPSP